MDSDGLTVTGRCSGSHLRLTLVFGELYTIQKPALTTIVILTGRTIFTMELPIAIPVLRTSGILNGRTIFTMELTALEVIPFSDRLLDRNLVGLHRLTPSASL